MVTVQTLLLNKIVEIIFIVHLVRKVRKYTIFIKSSVFTVNCSLPFYLLYQTYPAMIYSQYFSHVEHGTSIVHVCLEVSLTALVLGF